MDKIEVFYQGEGIGEIQHFEADSGDTFSAIKAKLCAKHGLASDTVLFLEDAPEPIDEKGLVREQARPAGIKLHLHRCRSVKVSVTFNGKTVEEAFAPSTTVARVKIWAARQFGMSEEEAGEHVLQIVGTHDRPRPGTHIGSLVVCSTCRVAFALIPDERINGWPEVQV